MKFALPTLILIVFLSLAVIGLGYNYFFRPIWNSWQANQPTDDASVPRQAASSSAQTLKNGLVATLSAQEKIAQLLVLPVSTLPVSSGSAQVLDPATETWLKTYKPGFVQLVGTKSSSASATLQPLSFTAAERTLQAIDVASAALPWSPLKVVRHSSGDTQTLRGTGFTRLPTMAQICAEPLKYEPVLAKSAGELSRLKIAVVIGPVVDLQSAGGFQGSQICADALQIVPAAQKYVENFGAVGIMPVLAHFPGIGQAQVAPQREVQTLSVTVSELKPFQQLLKIYPNLGVLVSPVKVSEKFGDQFCVFSRECLATFAKDYSQALVIADGASPQNLAVADIIKQSLLAGNHIVVLDPAVSLPDLTQALDQLTQEYQANGDFRQAVETGWQHVFALRVGEPQNQKP